MISPPMIATGQLSRLDRIVWGPYDDHLIYEDDVRGESTGWYVGIRGSEFWQLRMIWPSPASVNWTPDRVHAEINLGVWCQNTRGMGRFHETIWSHKVALDEHELDQIKRNEFANEDDYDAYSLLRNKALSLADRFIEDPYAVLMEVNL
jgi:hypothetical protein